MEFKQGMFRVLGDVIDVYPADSDNQAIRIEIFDDEIESLSYFDPLTGEVLKTTRQLTIFPKTHYVTPREIMLQATDKIKIELTKQLKSVSYTHLTLPTNREV